MLKSSFFRRILVILSAHLVLLLGMAASWMARGDASKPAFDPRDCVCTYMRTAPIDIFTARFALHDGIYQYEVVEILTHGLVQRQVVGQPIAGLRSLQGSALAATALIYAGQTDGDFYNVAIPSLNVAEVFLRSVDSVWPVPARIETHCRTEFGLPQLIRFMEALAANEGTCHKLATKYLGLPKPQQTGHEPAILDCSGGTTGTAALGLVAVALVVVALRRARSGVGSRGGKP